MRYLIKFITLFFLVAFLSSCTKYYDKPGATQQGFAKDNAECLGLCGQAGGANGCTMAVQHVYESCMLGKGWKETTKP